MSHAPPSVLQSQTRAGKSQGNSGNQPISSTNASLIHLTGNGREVTSSIPSSRIVQLQSNPRTMTTPVNACVNLFPSTTTESSLSPLLKRSASLVGVSESIGGLNGGRCGQQCAARDSVVARDLTGASPLPVDTVPTQENVSVYADLYAILRTLWSGQRTVISPSYLLYTIWTAMPSFKGYRQQDAQEFLSVLLDRLQSEIHGDQNTIPVNTRDFVNRTFQGHSVSHIRCSVCSVIACTEEPFSELSLALPPDCYSGDATECDLSTLLRQFVSPTPIDGQGYACRECNRRHVESLSNRRDASGGGGGTEDASRRDSRPATPFKVDRQVSVALSRLPTPSSDCAPFSPDPPLRQPRSRSSIPSSTTSMTGQSLSPDSTAAISDGKSTTPGAPLPLPPPASVLSPSSCSPTSAYSLATGSHTPSKVPPSQADPIVSPCLTDASQTIRLMRLPRVLRLHIKRFRWIGRQREKVGCHVAFPLVLDMSEFMLNHSDRRDCSRHDTDTQNTECSDVGESRTGPHLYHLTGCIVHHGRGFQSGHYTSYCLNDEPECWLNCNDANVSLCDYSEVAASQAYLLFYSELMPVSRYPNWLDANSATALRASMKRSHSAAFLDLAAGQCKARHGTPSKPPTMLTDTRQLTVQLSPSLRRRALSTTNTESIASSQSDSVPVKRRISVHETGVKTEQLTPEVKSSMTTKQQQQEEETETNKCTEADRDDFPDLTSENDSHSQRSDRTHRQRISLRRVDSS